jgi:hypothetical protein
MNPETLREILHRRAAPQPRGLTLSECLIIAAGIALSLDLLIFGPYPL